MAVIVVGGSNRGAGKTALVCGLLSALPEFRWTAVKISSHDHGLPQPFWEETEPGQQSDTARYLAARARRAEQRSLSSLLEDLWAKLGPDAHVIFESNQVLHHVQPDLCLAVEGPSENEPKPSFRLVLHQKDAGVKHAERDHVIAGAKPLFQLASLERISPEMLTWLRQRLADSQRAKAEKSNRAIG